MQSQDLLSDPQPPPILSASNVSNEQEHHTPDTENFVVCVRVRPLHPRETSKKHPKKPCNVINVQDQMVIVLDPDGNTDPAYKRDKMYVFDNVFDETFDTKSVFNNTMLPLLDNVLNGYNATLFAYGMTGAGKTHTLFGEIDPDSLGVRRTGLIFLTLEELFRKTQSSTYGEYEFSVKISYLEIYNEQVRDLLRGDDQNLMILEDPLRGVFVSDLTETSVTNESQIMQLIMSGNSRRIMASTAANTFSSRSHAIVQVLIERKEKTAGIKGTVLQSKLSLIDLAGSERAAATENRGIRMLEGANINRSLLALGNCINVLSDSSKKGAFVPYRDSKLTRLLKDSLGGNTKTIMIACVSPSYLCYEETVNTLKYATRAKNIKRKLTRNVKEVELHVSQYKEIIENLKSEVESLKKQLKAKGHNHSRENLDDDGAREINEETIIEEQRIDTTSHKILDNLEQNWEIAQTLQELYDLETQNNETLADLYAKLSNIPHEDKFLREQVLKQIETLKKTMDSNEKTKNDIVNTLQGNIKENNDLKAQLVEFASTVDTLEDIELAKKLLDLDKMNLVTQNREIKKEALNLAKAKVQQNKQISQMEEQMRIMQAMLMEKDRMLASNNELIQDLRSKISTNTTMGGGVELSQRSELKEDSARLTEGSEKVEDKGAALQNLLLNLEKKITCSLNELDTRLPKTTTTAAAEFDSREFDSNNSDVAKNNFASGSGQKTKTFEEYCKEVRNRAEKEQDQGPLNLSNLETVRTVDELSTVRRGPQLEKRSLMDENMLMESLNSLQQQFMVPTPSDIFQKMNKHHEKYDRTIFTNRSKILANHNDIPTQPLNCSTLRESRMRLAVKGLDVSDVNTMNSSDLGASLHTVPNNTQRGARNETEPALGHEESQDFSSSLSNIKLLGKPQLSSRSRPRGAPVSNETNSTPLLTNSKAAEFLKQAGYADKMFASRQSKPETSYLNLRRQSFHQAKEVAANVRERSAGNVRASMKEGTQGYSGKYSNMVMPKERLTASVLEQENSGVHNVSMSHELKGLEIKSLGQERENLKNFRNKLGALAALNPSKLTKDSIRQIKELIEEYNVRRYILPVKDQESLRLLGEAIIKYENKENAAKSKNNTPVKEEKKARSSSVRGSNANLGASIRDSKDLGQQRSSYYQQNKDKRERKASVNSRDNEAGGVPQRRNSIKGGMPPGVLSNLQGNYSQTVSKLSMAAGGKNKSDNTGGYSRNKGGDVSSQMASIFGKTPPLSKEKENNVSGFGDSKKYARNIVGMLDSHK